VQGFPPKRDHALKFVAMDHDRANFDHSDDSATSALFVTALPSATWNILRRTKAAQRLSRRSRLKRRFAIDFFGVANKHSATVERAECFTKIFAARKTARNIHAASGIGTPIYFSVWR
jgi:hypothetical protein